MKGQSEIVLYKSEDGSVKIDVLLQNDTVWLTIDQMSELFGKSRSTINEHIINVYAEKELNEDLSIRKIGISDFSTKPTNFYNLDVIISVGYRVRSTQGTQFRIWATNRLREYIVKGFTLNDERFKTGESMNYFHELLDRIRDIRLSEKVFYQQIKDIYKTSKDYDPSDKATIAFFAEVQNKFLWAVSKQTAAEIVYYRSNAALPQMGMTSIGDKRVLKKEVSIAKNYLSEQELGALKLLVEQYLAYAEAQAQAHKVMYMSDWIKKLGDILTMNDREILSHAGRISHDLALAKSEAEYGKFKIEQRKLERVESIKELIADVEKATRVKK